MRLRLSRYPPHTGNIVSSSESYPIARQSASQSTGNEEGQMMNARLKNLMFLSDLVDSPALDQMYAGMASRLDNFCTCYVCHRRQPVDPAKCLRFGWPQCCDRTMASGALKS